jgi:FtsP/CotA-like multicopper oxidase with cupredoxin domain
MAILFAFLFYISYASARSNPFILNLTWESGSPDGGPERDLIKMNGHFTGPLLEIIQGDWVEMLVQNNMPFNTTIHAHGIIYPDIPSPKLCH